MSFFSVEKDIEDESAGILYLLYFKLDDDTHLVKIGITQRPKIQDRVCEILSSFFMSYRYFPYCYPKRFKKTSEVFKKEAMMHEYYKECNYKFDKKFGGYSEFFLVKDLEELLELYQKVLDGEDVNVRE